jgi:hypothetical protein
MEFNEKICLTFWRISDISPHFDSILKCLIALRKPLFTDLSFAYFSVSHTIKYVLNQILKYEFTKVEKKTYLIEYFELYSI